ncbi:MAG: hypothetical protein GEU98_23305 [Pseudonocardiaceae bacterium]|nr:hypothetical protein [Pseudonocardiaceae bacterium]
MRGGLLAISSAALAVTAHAAGGGGLPDAGSTLVLTVLLGWVGTALADRTSGVLPILAVLGVSQLTLHVLLAELIHAHSAIPADPSNGPAMTAAHAAATVLTGLALAGAESALIAVCATVRSLLPAPSRPAPVAHAPSAVPVPRPERAVDPFEVLLRAVCARRGPPARS